MPGWIREYSGAKPEFSFTSGNEFPDDLEGFELVVHCGGCMLNEKAMKSRINICRANGVPIVNFGIAIARMRGMLDRALEQVSDFIAPGGVAVCEYPSENQPPKLPEGLSEHKIYKYSRTSVAIYRKD